MTSEREENERTRGKELGLLDTVFGHALSMKERVYRHGGMYGIAKRSAVRASDMGARALSDI